MDTKTRGGATTSTYSITRIQTLQNTSRCWAPWSSRDPAASSSGCVASTKILGAIGHPDLACTAARSRNTNSNYPSHRQQGNAPMTQPDQARIFDIDTATHCPGNPTRSRWLETAPVYSHGCKFPLPVAEGVAGKPGCTTFGRKPYFRYSSQGCMRTGLHPGDHQPALHRVNRGLRLGASHRSATGLTHPPRAHPGDERRELQAQTQPGERRLATSRESGRGIMFRQRRLFPLM